MKFPVNHTDTIKQLDWLLTVQNRIDSEQPSQSENGIHDRTQVDLY